MTSPLLMEFTDEGIQRIGQIYTDGLVFAVTTIAYGTYGYDALNPANVEVLFPSDTALVAEVYRKDVERTTIDNNGSPRGQETTYTTLGGDELPSLSGLGEAGLFAVVSDAGTTGLAVGYEFLLVQAHFPRQCMQNERDRLAIVWPVDYELNVFIGNISITNLLELEAFQAEEYLGIVGNLSIVGNAALIAEIYSPTLVFITGDLDVECTSGFGALDFGFESVTSIGSVTLTYTGTVGLGSLKLTSCFSSLDTITNTLTLGVGYDSAYNNFVYLTSVGGSIVVDQTLIDSADDFGFFPMTVADSLLITTNANLINVSSFDEIIGSSLSGVVTITNNPALPSILQAQALINDLVASGFVGVSTNTGNL
jgi:hypothetical protein